MTTRPKADRDVYPYVREQAIRDCFIRNQHPDKRSEEQWVKVMQAKGFKAVKLYHDTMNPK